MIGILGPHSSMFLRVIAVLVTLALYFGRCLGVLALILSWAAWHASGHPELQPLFFQMFIGMAVLMTVVRIVGALQRVQPWTVTAKIPSWAGLALLGLISYPVAHV